MNPETYPFILQITALGMLILGGAGLIIEELRRRALKRQLAELTQQLEEAQRELERLRAIEADLEWIEDDREEIR
jgi:hypothetical protein